MNSILICNKRVRELRDNGYEIIGFPYIPVSNWARTINDFRLLLIQNKQKIIELRGAKPYSSVDFNQVNFSSIMSLYNFLAQAYPATQTNILLKNTDYVSPIIGETKSWLKKHGRNIILDNRIRLLDHTVKSLFSRNKNYKAEAISIIKDLPGDWWRKLIDLDELIARKEYTVKGTAPNSHKENELDFETNKIKIETMSGLYEDLIFIRNICLELDFKIMSERVMSQVDFQYDDLLKNYYLPMEDFFKFNIFFQRELYPKELLMKIVSDFKSSGQPRDTKPADEKAIEGNQVDNYILNLRKNNVRDKFNFATDYKSFRMPNNVRVNLTNTQAKILKSVVEEYYNSGNGLHSKGILENINMNGFMSDYWRNIPNKRSNIEEIKRYLFRVEPGRIWRLNID